MLLFHPKLHTWLPPGGHLEADETPENGAIREVFEETGLKIALFSDENIWCSRNGARSIRRPYLCLLEDIPAFGDKKAHQHIDLVFTGLPEPLDQPILSAEKLDVRWFSRQEIENLSDKEIFEETRQIALHLLDQEAMLVHG